MSQQLTGAPRTLPAHFGRHDFSFHSPTFHCAGFGLFSGGRGGPGHWAVRAWLCVRHHSRRQRNPRRRRAHRHRHPRHGCARRCPGCGRGRHRLRVCARLCGRTDLSARHVCRSGMRTGHAVSEWPVVLRWRVRELADGPGSLWRVRSHVRHARHDLRFGPVPLRRRSSVRGRKRLLRRRLPRDHDRRAQLRHLRARLRGGSGVRGRRVRDSSLRPCVRRWRDL